MLTTLNKEALAELAFKIWSAIGFRRGLTGQEVREAIESASTGADILALLLVSPDGQIVLQGLARWAWESFPSILLGHKYAAALLATETPLSILREVAPPWEGFMIDVPTGLLWVNDPALGRDVEVRRILACQIMHEGSPGPSPGGLKWAWLAFTESHVSLWRYGVDAEGLLPPDLEGNAWEGSPLLLDTTDQDDRTCTLIGRLILNTCLAMRDPDFIREAGPGHEIHRRAAARQMRPLRPVPRIFRVGKDVSIDLRGVVRNYLQHGKKLQATQYVIGHWKRVPYGPNSSLRKIVWIMPYERGPDTTEMVGIRL
jgi:hypothetical protein